MSPHVIYQPHTALKNFVRYYWSLDIQLTGGPLLDLQVMADRFPRVVIQCMEGKNVLHSDHYRSIYAASLKGITSKPALVKMEPTYSHVAVSFFPHGVKALFGVNGSETTDAVLDLHEFFPRDVIEKIIDTRRPDKRIALLDAYLLKRLSTIRPIDWRVMDFLHACPRTHYGRQLKNYGISERQFERKFLDCIGFTPSYYKRVLRFESAVFRIQQGLYESLANLSYELGYSDQSHFNREIKQFSSLTPVALIKKNELVNESGSILAG
jgi:AraC-like DNA-binding protein